MRRTVTACLLAAFAVTAGCGSDDSIQGVEATQTPAATTTPTAAADDSIQGVDPTATPTAAAGEDAITKRALYDCIEGTDLKLSKEAGPVPGQEDVTRANFELDGTEYAGFVVWPSGAIADIWLASDEAGAEAAERQYEAVWKQYGKADQGEQLVQRKANAVVGLDDDHPPGPDETPTLDDCLQPGA